MFVRSLILFLALAVPSAAPQYFFFQDEEDTSLAEIKEVSGVEVKVKSCDHMTSCQIRIDEDSPLVAKKGFIITWDLVVGDVKELKLALAPIFLTQLVSDQSAEKKPYYEISFGINDDLLKSSYFYICWISRRQLVRKVWLSEFAMAKPLPTDFKR